MAKSSSNVRVISGSAGGLFLQVPHKFSSRPTQGKIKQALFSSLGAYVEEARVLDIYSGSGSLGIEALSRGAASCTFVEKNAHYCKTITANLKHCHFDGREGPKTFLHKGEAHRYIKQRAEAIERQQKKLSEVQPEASERLDTEALEKKIKDLQYDLIMLDPPYEKEPTDLSELSWIPALASVLTPSGLIVWEHSSKDTWGDETSLKRTKESHYGDTTLSWFEKS